MGRQDEHGKDVIAIRPLMNITLTYDHRLVDGALAGRFLRDLRGRLEVWEGRRASRVRSTPASGRGIFSGCQRRDQQRRISAVAPVGCRTQRRS